MGKPLWERLAKIAPSTEAQPITVLYVDDEIEVLKVVKQMLELQGSFHVETTSSVKEALQKMKSTQFDVVVSDYLMPEKNGLDFLRDIRESGIVVPFILFTGKGREDIAIQALNLGADHYVNKIGKPETVFGELAHAIRQVVDKKRIEKHLLMLSSVVEQSSSSIVILDKSERILYGNPKFLEIHNSRFEDVIGKKWQPWVANGTTLKEETQNIRDIIFKQKKMWSGEVFNIVKNGEMVWRRSRIFPLLDENNSLSHIVCIGEDITEQRKTEQTIWEREERLRAILASSPDSMIVVDIHGKIIDCNMETLTLLEFPSKAEMLGKDYADLLVSEDKKEVMKAVKELFKNGTVNRHECRLLTKSGLKIPVEYSANLLKDSQGNLVGAVCLARNTSDRKQMGKELKESEERYRKQFEENLDAIFLADAQTGILVDCNNAATKLVGRDKSELIGQHQRILHHAEESIDKFSKVFKHFLKDKQDFLETQIITKNGKIRDVMIRASTFKLRKKTIVQGIFRDITERKHIEQELKDSEQKYRTMIEQAPDAIFTFDLNGTVTSCNHVALSITGYSENELIGKTFPEFVPLVDSSKELYELFNSLFSGGVPEPFQVNFITKSGATFFGEIHTSLLKKGDKVTGFQAIVRDVTERKKAEEALRESEKRFRELSELLPEVIFETDSRATVTFVNHEAYSKFGYSKEEFEKGINAAQFIVPEQRDTVKKNHVRLMSGKETGPSEYMAIRKDGTTFPIIVNSSPVFRENRAVGARGVMVDITEHVKTETALKETLNQMETLNEKLATVGRLTRHDARNKLSTIMNNIYLAKQHLGGNEFASAYLDAAESAIRQMENIFEFSKIYEKLGTEKLSDVDVKKSLNEAFMLSSGTEKIEFVNECDGLTVVADSLLRQFFYNLIGNSVKHGEKVSQIRTYYKEEPDKLKIVYEDDGVGIPEHEKKKIFEEGYGKGSGYGLYLISKICEVYGWNIQETGEFGKGAQFTIIIPKK